MSIVMLSWSSLNDIVSTRIRGAPQLWRFSPIYGRWL